MSLVLVTGGGGFLGAPLCNRLADDGESVQVLDNGSSAVGRLRGIHERIVYHCGSVTNEDSVRSAFENTIAGAVIPDSVFHLAAMNGATRDFYEKPWQVLDTQIRGTMNVIDACVKHNIKTLVLFSSSEVYNSPPIIPSPENVARVIPDITNPRFSYSGGKIAAELLAWHSPIEKVVCILPHNCFGPNAGYGHVIPEMVMRAARTPDKGTFDINGQSTRSFIYIDDFADAMVAIWNHTQKQTGRVREIYHVGTEEQVSMTALAGYISDIMGRKSEKGYAYRFKTKSGPAGGTHARCPDTAKLRSLGWSQKVPLMDGLKRTVHAYLEKQGEWPQ